MLSHAVRVRLVLLVARHLISMNPGPFESKSKPARDAVACRFADTISSVSSDGVYSSRTG